MPLHESKHAQAWVCSLRLQACQVNTALACCGVWGKRSEMWLSPVAVLLWVLIQQKLWCDGYCVAKCQGERFWTKQWGEKKSWTSEGSSTLLMWCSVIQTHEQQAKPAVVCRLGNVEQLEEWTEVQLFCFLGLQGCSSEEIKSWA